MSEDWLAAGYKDEEAVAAQAERLRKAWPEPIAYIEAKAAAEWKATYMTAMDIAADEVKTLRAERDRCRESLRWCERAAEERFDIGRKP
jgi:hypothetical protein